LQAATLDPRLSSLLFMPMPMPCFVSLDLAEQRPYREFT
jgi:hypothetical protein